MMQSTYCTCVQLMYCTWCSWCIVHGAHATSTVGASLPSLLRWPTMIHGESFFLSLSCLPNVLLQYLSRSPAMIFVGLRPYLMSCSSFSELPPWWAVAVSLPLTSNNTQWAFYRPHFFVGLRRYLVSHSSSHWITSRLTANYFRAYFILNSYHHHPEVSIPFVSFLKDILKSNSHSHLPSVLNTQVSRLKECWLASSSTLLAQQGEQQNATIYKCYFPHQGWFRTELKAVCVSCRSCPPVDHLCSWLDRHQVGWQTAPEGHHMVILCYKARHSHFGSFTWTCSSSTITYYGESSLTSSIILFWATLTLSNSLGSHYAIDCHQML